MFALIPCSLIIKNEIRTAVGKVKIATKELLTCRRKAIITRATIIDSSISAVEYCEYKDGKQNRFS